MFIKARSHHTTVTIEAIKIDQIFNIKLFISASQKRPGITWQTIWLCWTNRLCTGIFL